MHEQYNEILKALHIYCGALSDAMTVCQSLGYNGLKRRYRHGAQKMYKLCLSLKNEMYDDHMIIAQQGHNHVPAYKPSDIRQHSYEWLKVVSGTLSIIAKASIAIYQATGKQSKAICKAVKCLYKDQEKIRRWIARGEELDWMGHDLHRQDDTLHDKEKARGH